MTRRLRQLEKIRAGKSTSEKSSQARGALNRIRTRAQKLKLARLDWEALKAHRDAGRP